MAALTFEAGIDQFPLFIDYGQRSVERELAACRTNLTQLGIGVPHVAKVPGYGGVAKSGLTDPNLDVFIDAFTPGRNLLFLLLGASYAVTAGATGVAIGLLDERAAIFPDQTSEFLRSAEGVISLSMGREVRVIAPLMHCTKGDVLALARQRSIASTYSCHVGGERPCGVCVACREFHIHEEA